MSNPTKEPVTISGWYENVDGTWTEYAWRNGQLCPGRTQAQPETPDERLRRWADEDQASRLTKVVTYALAYLPNKRAILCADCVLAGDHEHGALGPVLHGLHRGDCEGMRHNQHAEKD